MLPYLTSVTPVLGAHGFSTDFNFTAYYLLSLSWAWMEWYIGEAMPVPPCDTHPAAEKVQIEMLRAMPAAEKFRVLNDLIVTGRILSLGCLRDRFPKASPEELRRRLATLLLGSDLATTVYGPEPQPPTVR